MIVNNLPSDYRYMTVRENVEHLTQDKTFPDVIKVRQDQGMLSFAVPAAVPVSGKVEPVDVTGWTQ
jgi:hypothetical protein